jgi:general secretion pathway protein D
MAHATSAAGRLVILLALALAASGCATAGALRAARQAETLQDFDRAVLEYTRALREDPNNREARHGLERTRLRAALEHLTRGRRHEAAGRLAEALAELQIAAELNPTDGDVHELLEKVRSQLRTRVATTRGGKTELQTLIERTRDLPPLGASLPDIRLPDTLTFVNAPSQVIYEALAKFAGISLVFDPQFRSQPLTIDLRNMTLERALQAVSEATRNFYRLSSEQTVTVIPDTPAKRAEYEEEVVRVFPLSNADIKEVVDALRIVIDARRIAPVTDTNTIAIKDTPERVAAAGRLISMIDKARPEVVIDVELLEVDRQRLREYGLRIGSPGSSGLDGGVVVPDELTLRGLRTLGQSDIVMTNLPGLFYRLLKSDSNTRTLANPQLRTSDGETAAARFGERVPVPQTTFAPIATGGVAQQPITSFVYQNIGVNIDITPRTHHDDEVSLALKIEVSSISGEGFGGLPTFGSREISTTIRLRDGETNLLAGLIRDDERRSLSGIPWLSGIPIIGQLFAQNRRTTQETDIVLTLTPRIIRTLTLTDADLRPFRVGRDAGSAAGVVELPLPEPASQPAQPSPVQPLPRQPETLPGAPPIFTPPAQPQPQPKPRQ